MKTINLCLLFFFIISADVLGQNFCHANSNVPNVLHGVSHNTSTTDDFGVWINGEFIDGSNGDGKFDLFAPNSHFDAIDIYLFAKGLLFC